MHLSFSDVAILTPFDPKSSAVIASSFAFLSAWVARPFLPRSLPAHEIIQHFSSPDPTFSESLPGIIAKLGHLGTDWLKQLLRNCLDAAEDASSRFLVKSIAAIIGHNPKVFLAEVLAWVGENIAGHLTLLGFLLCQCEDSLGDMDLWPIAAIAARILGNPESVFTDLDSSVLLLSLQTPSFALDVGELAQGLLPLRVSNATETVEVKLKFERVSGRPPIYRLALPYRVLQPRPEDSALVLAAKLKTLASHEQYPLAELYEILEPNLLANYSDRTSAAVQALARCVNRLFVAIPGPRLRFVLRTVLFSNAISWHQSDDVLALIKQMDTALFVSVMGDPAFRELVATLIRFAHGSHEGVSRDAVDVLIGLASELTYADITDSLVSATNFFDSSTTVITLSALCKIFKRVNHPTLSLNCFSARLVEAFGLFVDDLTFLSAVFDFFTRYRWRPALLGPLLLTAKAIVTISIHCVSGKAPPWKAAATEDFVETVRTDVLTRHVDVLMSASTDYVAFLHPMRSALRFLFASDGDWISIAKKSFRYFPRECSRFYMKRWSTLTARFQDDFLDVLPQKLRYVGDDAVHALWCKFFEPQEKLLRDSRASGAVGFLTQVSSDLLRTSNHRSLANDVMMANFLLRMSSAVVVRYLRSLTAVQLQAFLEADAPAIPFLAQLDPELVAGFTPAAKAVAPSRPPPPALQLPADDGGFQEALERFVTAGDLRLVIALVRLAGERGVPLDIACVRFPKPFVAPLAAALAATQPRTFETLDAVERLMTDWRPLALAAVTDGAFLARYPPGVKLRKPTILGICSVVGILKFDAAALLALATDAFFTAGSARRFSLAITFLAVALAAAGTAEEALVDRIVQHLTEHFAMLFPPVLARLFVVISKVAPPTAPFAAFAVTVLPFCGAKTVAVGCLHQALLTAPGFVSPDYLIALSETVQPFLTSVMPSLYLCGLRMAEEAALAVPVERLIVGLRVPLDVISDRFVHMAAYPNVADAQCRVISAVLGRSGTPTLHMHLVKYMPQRFQIQPGTVGYVAGLQFWPLVVGLVKTDEFTKKIWPFTDQLILSAWAFDVGLACLRERMLRIPARQQSAFILPFLRAWIGKNKVGRLYKRILKMCTWFDFSMEFDRTVFRVVSVELVKGVTNFFMVYVAIMRAYFAHRGEEDIVEGLKRAGEGAAKKCHRAAVRLLSPTADRAKLLELACFDDDCPASDELTKALAAAAAP
jgi:hypothetical protein